MEKTDGANKWQAPAMLWKDRVISFVIYLWNRACADGTYDNRAGADPPQTTAAHARTHIHTHPPACA